MNTRMKKSGVEWIGDIPENWSHNTIFQLFTQVKNKNVGLREKNLLSLSYGKIKRRNIDALGGLLPENFEGYNIIKKDDIVLRLTDLQNDQTSLRTGIANEDGMITSAYLTIRNQSKNLPQFLAYFLHAFDVAKGFYGMGAGIRQGLTWDGIKWLRILVPPQETQRKIVALLDAQCAELDAVLEKTRQTVEEYKKLKQAVITQAVTCGVRGNRAMKDSGIQWIGEIPAEWRKTKVLSCLSEPITDGPHTTPQLFDEGIAFVSAEAVSCGKGKIDFSHIRGYISESFYEECCKKYIPAINDIYMIKSGATTGRVAMVDTLEPKFTIWSPLAVFRCNNNIIKPRFLFYQLQAEFFQKQIEFGWTFGTQQNIGMRVLEQLKIILPFLDEQAEIADHLDRQCAEIDALIAKKEQYQSEIETYKKSLIYEVVTGKREVA